MKTHDQKPATPNISAPLAIIGIGCLFPQADDQQSYWSNIADGIDSISDIPDTHWKVADYYDQDQKSPDRTYGQRGGFISPVDFNPMEFNIPPNVLEAIDTSQLLGLVAAGQALKDAGYGPEREYDRSKASVILGVTGTLELVIPLGARLGHPIWRKALKDAGVDENISEDVVQRISEAYVPWQENSFPGLLGNVVAGRISKQFDLGGTNCVVDAACASSFSALHLASMELATGKSDIVVTGGIDTFNDIFMYMCFSKTPALSPTGNAKPFDAAADGTILGEGLGIVVLKRLADAERDGDKIYAVIRGVGSSSDGKGDAIYAPSAAGQKKALLDAYDRAGVTPESIGLVEAHGTGTKVGDAVEVSALRDVYGEADTPWCSLGSVKSQIGHTKASAGAAGMIKAALALHHKVLPPTIKVKKPLDEVTSGRTPFYLTTEKRPWLPRGNTPRRAAVSAFGFGGSNFHLVLEEYRAEKAAVEWNSNIQIFAFSGANADELETALAAVPVQGSWNELRTAAAASRSSFNNKAHCRLTLVVERNLTQPAALFSNARNMLQKNSQSAWNTPDGTCYACGEKTGALGMLFPGQGAQYTGMLRDLTCRFPQALTTLAAADKGYGTADGKLLSDLIYPASAFDNDSKERQEVELRATETAQPAIGAVSLAALKIFESFGIVPEAAAGHSYGELTALCAAGVFDEQVFQELSRLRGSLMGAGSGDKGSMLAVPAALATVEQIIAEESLDLVIANRNAPSQAILSGSSAEIERAAKVFTERKLACKRLPVAAAFHSPLVADAAVPFLAAVEKVEFNTPKIPVYANSSAAEYPADMAAAKKLLAGQLAKPVEFVAEIEAMYAAGVRLFLEAGPGARLTGLVSAILGQREHVAIALDASGGKRSGMTDLARVLARLAAIGCDLQLTAWDGDYRPATGTGKKPLMTVPICGANYVKPKPARPAVAAIPRPTAAPPSAPRTTLPDQYAAPQATAQAPVSRDTLAESLRVTREGMAVLQKMQEKTAQLHRRFLEGQETASRTIQTLLEQQQSLLQGGSVSLRSFSAPTAPQATVVPQSTPVVAATIPTPAAPAAPIAAVAALPASNQITETLLAVVAEKTGYPVEMLELEMGMDSDLGIDSIKRVEILSALQERIPGSPVIGPEQLGTLRTLGEIAAFLGAGAATSTPAAVTAVPSNNITETLLAVVAEKTGYPVEMLELEMGMDSDLGIDSIKRVEILSALQERIPGSPVIDPEHLGTLRTLGEIANFLRGSAAPSTITTQPTPAAPQPSNSPAADTSSVNRSTVVPCALEMSAGKITIAAKGELWVTDDGSAFSNELCLQLRAGGRTVRLVEMAESDRIAATVDMAALVIVAPLAGTDDDFLEKAFLLLKGAAPALRRAGGTGGALFTTVSRLDGAFGCGEGTLLNDPLSGGLAGLAKTAAREWPDVTCKAIDLGAFADPAASARAVAEELFRVGPVEVGLNSDGRTGLALTDLPELPHPQSAPVQAGDVIVATGGGRGVTAAVAVALAEAYRPLLVLLGRSPELTPEPAWLESLTEESAIKRAILDHATEKMHPKAIEEQYQAILAGRELRTTLARVEAAGGKALYRSVDIRNSDAVGTLLTEIRREHGPIRGIIHGAGVLADRLIVDKTREQFAQVYGTKVTGLRTLLAATAGDELSFIALFASTTGRFGRTGQVDYAVANEVLNKLAQSEARCRPACRAISINWGPWDGGMVTPALKKVFAGEGIGLISLAAGSELLIREIGAPEGPVEVVALAGKPAKAGISTASAPAKKLAETFSLTLGVADYPFLRSHVMDGKAVLPMAMIVEWLSHGALHGNPGFRFHGFNDLRVCKGVIFEANRPYSVQIMAGRAEKRDSLHIVTVELIGSGIEGRSILHARGEIVLAKRLPEGIRSIPDLPATPYTPLDGQLYNSQRLFHGPELQGIQQVDSCSPKGITATVNTAPQPAAWIKQPFRSDWLSDPLVIDCAFQMMILWCFERFGSGSLPCFAGRYRQYHDTFPRDGVQIVIRVTAEREHGATADMEFLDRQNGKLVARLEGYECVIDPSLGRAFQLNQLPQAGQNELRAA
ncbi:MAG: SDR family NAD(P)-dependent oxidoreductase [Geobacter sp.]|nr:SDR family NAD(P)-dependent oxidoreductase [Geobacter sp.]